MLQKLCTYNNWANSVLLDALTDISAIQSVAIPGYCITLLSHIANAQVIWTSRIRGNVPLVTVWQMHDLDTCRNMLQQSAELLKEIVEKEASPDRMVVYKTFAGDSFETAVSDILLHVFNHGTYHRAQIAKEMKNHGIEPVNTDYIRFVRC
jgi:uncharacterized damage-inducible protein DinB